MTANKLVVRAARIFTGLDDAPVADAAVLVENGSIAAVLDSASEAGADAELIDLGDVTLLPGMIDLHTHLTAWVNSWPRPFDRAMRYTAQGAANLSAALDRGVTTIRDVGSPGDLAMTLRDAVAEGVLQGPRVLACGKAVTITGGLGSDAVTGHLGPTLGWMVEADGPDGLRGAVRSQIKRDVDWIKLYYELGDWTPEELQAAVDQAHSSGVRVACHANRATAIRSAIEAGVDTVEHALDVTREDLSMMVDRGVAWVPTLLVMANRLAEIERHPEQFKITPDAMRRSHDNHRAGILPGLELGVEIGCGVDPLPDEGSVPFADVAGELGIMVELGMQPSEAIRVATTHSARILGLEDEIGQLRPGLAADLIAVEGNPLEDIRALERVSFVMRNGVPVRSPGSRQAERAVSGV